MTEQFWRTAQWWRTAGRTAIATWIATAVGLAATALIARSLGPRAYGAVVLAIAATGLIASLFDLSLDEAVIFHGFRLVQQGGSVKRLVRTALTIEVVNGAIVAVAAIAAAELIVRSVGGAVHAHVVRLAAVLVLSSTANPVTGAVLLLGRRPDLRAWCAALGSALRLIAVVVAAVFDASAGGFVTAQIAASVAIAVVQLAVSARVGRPLRLGPVQAEAWVRPLVRLGWHTTVTTSVIAVGAAAVPLVVGRLLGARETGLLDVAMLPVLIAAVASSPFRLMLLSEQAQLYATGQRAALRRSVWGYTAIGGVAGLVGIVAGWFALPWLIVGLYSERFAPAVAPARILLVAAAVGLATGWSKALPAAIGRPGLRTKVTLIEVGLLVAVTLVSARYGLNAVAASVSAVSAGVACVWVLVAKKMLSGDAAGITREDQL